MNRDGAAIEFAAQRLWSSIDTNNSRETLIVVYVVLYYSHLNNQILFQQLQSCGSELTLHEILILIERVHAIMREGINMYTAFHECIVDFEETLTHRTMSTSDFDDIDELWSEENGLVRVDSKPHSAS